MRAVAEPAEGEVARLRRSGVGVKVGLPLAINRHAQIVAIWNGDSVQADAGAGERNPIGCPSTVVTAAPGYRIADDYRRNIRRGDTWVTVVNVPRRHGRTVPHVNIVKHHRPVPVPRPVIILVAAQGDRVRSSGETAIGVTGDRGIIAKGINHPLRDAVNERFDAASGIRPIEKTVGVQADADPCADEAQADFAVCRCWRPLGDPVATTSLIV